MSVLFLWDIQVEILPLRWRHGAGKLLHTEVVHEAKVLSVCIWATKLLKVANPKTRGKVVTGAICSSGS